MAALADPLVRVALGEKWLDVIPLIPPLAFAGAANMLQTNIPSMYGATGRPYLIALTAGIQTSLLVPMLLAAVVWFGLVGVAHAFLLHSVLLSLPIAYWIFFRNSSVRPRDVGLACWRPLLACAVMYPVVAWYLSWVGTQSSLALQLSVLVGAVLLGALTYAVAILVLWQAAGRPAGAEQMVLEQALLQWQRRFRRDSTGS